MNAMLAEPIASQDFQVPRPPETPRSWLAVLGVVLAILLGAAGAGMAAGGVLHYWLMRWLAGPDAIKKITEAPYDVSWLPVEAQAIASADAFFLFGYLFMAPLGIALLLYAVPRPGPTAREYLGLKWPDLRQGLIWGSILLAVDFGYRFLVVRGLGLPWGKDDGIDEMARTPMFLPVVFLALAVLGPIFEELLYRGFLLEGLRRSRIGEMGAILITAGLLASSGPDTTPHVAGLFLMGALFAVARVRTGSVYLTMLVRVIASSAAVLAMAYG